MDKNKIYNQKEIELILFNIKEIRSRSNFPTDYYVPDEDVNLYFAHLLDAYRSADYKDLFDSFVTTPLGVTKLLTTSQDKSFKYFVFKTNADYILLVLAKIKQDKIYKCSKAKMIELAVLYYTQAVVYYNKIYKKTDGIGLVLNKLATYTQEYADVLNKVNILFYSNYVKTIIDKEFESFEKQFKEYEEKLELKGNVDKILDLWNDWKKTQDPKILNELNRRCALERKHNPDFKFSI